MDEELFWSRLAQWELMPGKLGRLENNTLYYDAIVEAKIDALCNLFLETSHEQRLQFPQLFADLFPLKKGHVIYDQLGLVYMRRVSKRIKGSGDVYPLRLGLAAAAIIEQKPDCRDVMVSLAFLHYAATQVGIDPNVHFQEMAESVSPSTKAFLLDFLLRQEGDIKNMVRQFGGL